MAPLTRRWWLFAGVMLAVASAASLTLLSSGMVLPSVVRDSIYAFVQPGVTVWWFFLGGLFQTAPSLPRGIAFAAGANAALLVAGAMARRRDLARSSSQSHEITLMSDMSCRLTNRWSGRVKDKVPSSYIGARAAQLNR